MRCVLVETGFPAVSPNSNTCRDSRVICSRTERISPCLRSRHMRDGGWSKPCPGTDPLRAKPPVEGGPASAQKRKSWKVLSRLVGVSSSYTWYTKASFCDVTSRGALPCSSATEPSAELLAAHSPPHDVCAASSWARAAAAFEQESAPQM
jgi:hypothetical protein